MQLKQISLLSIVASLALGASASIAQVALPQGHPDISHMTHAEHEAQLPATTQPATLGTLTIQAVQSTAGGAAVSGGQAVVDLYTQDQLLKSHEVPLDAAGRATLNDLPVSLGLLPVVRVVYNGIEYAAQGQAMDSTHPTQQIDVPVYEATAESPAWQIKMRHLMVQSASAEMLQVMDVLQVENPSDRAWTGAPAADGKGTTFVLPLPDGASNVQLIEGFHDCCTVIDAAGVHNQMALLPGVKLYRLAYTLPVESGNARISVTNPAPAGHVMVFVPNDGSQVQADGLSAVESKMDDGSTRFFAAHDLQAGKPVSLALSGVTASAATESASAPTATSTATIAKAIAGAGSILILLLGGAFMFLKGPKAKQE